MAQKKKKTKEKKSSESKELVPVVESDIGTIEITNYDEVKEEVESIVKAYEDYEVTEETLSEDKKVRAKLRKAAKKISDKRIEIKKEALKPVDAFEDAMKELSGMFKETASDIDEEIKKYDKKRKEEKKELAENIIAEKKELSDLPEEYLERIEFKDSFSNLSTSQKAIEDDVDEQIEALKKEYEVQKENEKVIKNKIEKVNKDIEGKLYPDDYIEKLGEETSLSEILGMIDNRVEEIKEEESEEVDVVEEQASKAAEDRAKEMDKRAGLPDEGQEEITVELKVTSTKFRLKNLKEYMVDNGINYELKK